MANKTAKIAKTATEALTILWGENYFREWRMRGVIEKHLAKRGNNFSGPELGMALKRSKRLTKRGRRGTYEYIQKYPFVKEPISKARKV